MQIKFQSPNVQHQNQLPHALVNWNCQKCYFLLSLCFLRSVNDDNDNVNCTNSEVIETESILWLLAFTKETPVKSTPLVSFIIACWAYVVCRIVRKLFSNLRVPLSAATCIISSPDFVTASNWSLLLLLYMYFVSFSNRPSSATADNEFSHGKPKIRTRATDAEGKDITNSAVC